MENSTPSPSSPELYKRLLDAKAKLRSLKPTHPNYQEQKHIREFDVQTLAKEVAIRRRASTEHNSALPARPISQTGRPMSNDGTYPLFAGLQNYADITNGLNGHFASDSILMDPSYQTSMPGSWNVEPLEPLPYSNDSTQQSGPDFPDAASPLSSDLDYTMPRKRHKSNLTLDEESLAQETDSTYTTAMTHTNPGPFESFDIPEDMFALLGGDPNESMKEMREEQLRQERLARDRQETLRQDEELARKLQSEWDSSRLADAENDAPVSSVCMPPPRSDFGGESSSVFLPPHNTSASSWPIEVESGNSRPPSQQSYSAFGPHRATPAASGPTKMEPPGSSRPSSSGFINISSDSTSPTDSSAVVGLDSNHPITLDSDDWLNDTLVNDSSNVDFVDLEGSDFGSTNAFNGLNGGLSGVGQTLYDSAKGFYTSAQNALSDLGGTSVYGNGNNALIDLSNNFSPTAIASSAMSRAGIDVSDTANYQNFMDRVNYVAFDPTRTKAEIKSLLENIRPDEDLPPENREGTPEAMTYPLMEHQKLGLAWLRKMEEGEQKGGILADDMGLGKTIQALSLMVSRRSSNSLCKTTLIICPVALLKQWEREIRVKVKQGPQHSLKTFILHGNTRLAPWEILRTYDVVLTTFGTLSSEHKRYEGLQMAKKNPNWRPTSKEHYLSMLDDQSIWYRVIIDEAQCIKNKGTRAAKAAFALKAKSRFCMTGTPMMNSVDELFSLVHFIKIQPWNEWKYFNDNFSKPLKGHSHRAKNQALEKLQVLLKAILMRRTKTSVIDGRPILNLPPRHDESVQAKFSEDEMSFYQALEGRTRLQFNKYLRAGTVGRHYSNILVLLLRLRQACCHPHLIKDFGEKDFSSELSADEMVNLAKSLSEEVVVRLKELTENEELGLCPICMDMSDNTTIFVPCGHNACSECFARITDPAQAIAGGDFVEHGSREAKCPNCRGKIEVSKIIDHATFKKVHMPQATGVLSDTYNDSDEADLTDTESESEDESGDDIDTNGNLKGFVVADDDEDDDAHDQSAKSSSMKALKASKKGKGKDKALQKEKRPRKTLALLKKESLSNAKAKRRYLRRLEKEWETSAKIEQTMDILRTLQAKSDAEKKSPEKIIIFSLFTSLLDLLEIPINREGWDYRRYDGSMKADDRNRSVEDFSDRRDCKILLTSLKAGNSGLNLAAASQVIIFEPFWNPYIEEQAIDRAHRIGQQQPVHVHRIHVEGTVEDRILKLQEKKRDLIESALDENASRRISRLSTRDLAFLFDVPLVRD